jgi:Mg-chelatase subunit ChlI
MLKGAKNFNQKIRQSDFGQSKSLADFLSRRKQKRAEASRKTRDEARKITQRISKQKASPQDDRRTSQYSQTRTSKPSRSRRSSSFSSSARGKALHG